MWKLEITLFWYVFHIIVISFSHLIHMIFIFLLHFWARDPDPCPKSHIFVIFLVIFFHIIFICLWKPSFSACPYGQSLQSMCVYGCLVPGTSDAGARYAFQRLRNGQGVQARHIQKYENNMKKYDQEYDENMTLGGPNLGPEPKHVIKIWK